jgi:hypothetical protein
MEVRASDPDEAEEKGRDIALKGYPARKFIFATVTDISCDALISSLREMVDVYGSDDGSGPIPIIQRAKAAIASASDDGHNAQQ